VLVPALLILTASMSLAATLTATWNASPESDIAGYKLSYGIASGNYTTTLDVGNVTSYVLTVPDGQTYYFVVQAYDTSGLLSPRSTEVAYTVAGTPSPTLTVWRPRAAVGVSDDHRNEFWSDANAHGTLNTHARRIQLVDSIVVSVPSGATTAACREVNGAANNGLTYTVTSLPTLTSLAPTSGPVGTSVTITGATSGQRRARAA
jgi:hypothetical protein